MNRFTFGLLVLVLYSLQAIAGEPFDYAQAAIQSLAAVKDVTSDTPRVANMGPSEGLREMMRACVLQRTAVEAQRRRLERYAASKDEMIAQSAGLIVNGYDLITANLSATATSVQSVLDNPKRAFLEQGTTSREIYELEAKNQQAWALLMKVTTTIAFALYDGQRPNPDGKLQRLRITKAERGALKSELVKRYGKGITKESKDSPVNAVPGELLYGFLANSKWLDADAK